MGTFHRFEDVEAWQMARELTRMIYHLGQAGDFDRDLGLKDQIRRAAVSVMNNIAEGFERGTKRILQSSCIFHEDPPVKFGALYMSLVIWAISRTKPLKRGRSCAVVSPPPFGP